jgi:hypothetical protein
LVFISQEKVRIKSGGKFLIKSKNENIVHICTAAGYAVHLSQKYEAQGAKL